jgi:hypothetical protein
VYIRLDRLGHPCWRKRPLDREIDQGKRRGRLRPAVFEDLEIVSCEVPYKRAGLVRDDGVNFDEVGFGPERDGGWQPSPRLLRGTQGRTREERERHDPGTAHRVSSAVRGYCPARS